MSPVLTTCLALIASCAALLTAAGVQAATVRRPSSPDASLAMLAPVASNSMSSFSDVAGLEKAFELFSPAPTHEGNDRLEVIERVYHEKFSYQTGTQLDRINDLNERRDLARWYLRALWRAQLSALVRQAKATFRYDRVHREQVEHNQSAFKDGRSPASPAAGSRSPDSVAASEPGQIRVNSFEHFLAQATRFVEEFTNGGVLVNVDEFRARFALDPQSAVLNTSVTSPVISLGASYLTRSGDRPLPFSGAGSESGRERLVLSGARVIPGVGVQSWVRYDYFHQSLSCALRREFVGLVAAQVERSWELSGGGPMSSKASLSLSMLF